MRLFRAPVLLLLLGATALATTVLGASLEQLTAFSDRVARAKVVSLKSRWSGDHSHIFTDVTLDVLESLKGQGPSRIVVRQPGGVVGDVGQTTSGLATFRAGQEVVVFLERHGPVFRITGMAQGVYQVDRKDGRAMARPAPLGDLRVVDRSSGRALSPYRPAMALEQLEAQIRAAAAR